MPKRVGKNGELFEKLISDDNLERAIDEVNRTHHWLRDHRPNRCTGWVELTKPERIKELREIIANGFEQSKPRMTERWDASARKTRTICEPRQWPDQYVHHALIQVLQPVFMRGMDAYCCGSIRGRGTSRVKNAIEKWVQNDYKGTKYELSADIRHFYDTLTHDVVMERMKRLIKDNRILDLIHRITKDGIYIGFYTSQWFANVVLQPLDVLIRQSNFGKHYVRYMDNITVFGSNKRFLKRLRVLIEEWLNAHDLELKDNWQIFKVESRTKRIPLDPPRNGVERAKHRLPDAVGYRYGRNYTLPRKFNFYRLKKQIALYKKKRKQHKKISYRLAASIMSRLGQLKHCNNQNLYKTLFKGVKLQKQLKNILKEYNLKEMLTWSMYLEYLKNVKYSQQKEVSTATCQGSAQ